MSTPNVSAEALWAQFRSMPVAARDRFIDLLVSDVSTRRELEDHMDLVLVEERRSEPSRPFREVARELRDPR